ncbi:recombinase family protein [Ruminococcaceae bacterium OttesenSCG-928-L11]|nr:recombinase family protein [Ruminococcaceae bacterium OttesenSCG-928-L11]
MAKQKEHRVGIYARLSNEDKRAGESVSIENQVLMLTAHVKSQGWELVEVYRDDGFSGTNQNRPALQQMLADVRRGRINVVLIKDLSRLGRNYLEVGTLQEEFFPDHGCELISYTEKMDEMAVFRNFFNQQYSKDTSKKVRSVKKMCAQNGKYMGTYCPYGYRRNPENKHQFVIDENTAPIIRKIFELRVQGKGYKAIGNYLNESGVIPPRDYYYQQKKRENTTNINHCWCDGTVKAILENEVYIGNLVQGKVGTVSYKNHKTVAKPREEWIRAEGTHEAIIDREIWDQVQKIAEKRYQPRKQRDGAASIFSGLLVCADCGFKMRILSKKQVRKSGKVYRHTSFICGNYGRSGKAACTTHTIEEGALHELVAEQIRAHARMVEYDESRMIEDILQVQNDESQTSRTAYLSELKAHQNRLSMLEQLIAKLYEDRLTGTVPETVFRGLIQKYEAERIDRQESAKNLESRIQSMRQSANGASKWAKMIRQYTMLEVLDAQILLLLVDRIEIGEPVMVHGQRVRDIKIVYNYVGDIGSLHAADEADSGEAVSAYGQAV